MAAEASFTHRALNGRRFQLSGQLDLGLPCTSVVGVVVRGRLHEISSGQIGLGDGIAQASGVRRPDEELSYQGGTLRLGRTRPYSAGVRLVEDLITVRGRAVILVLLAVLLLQWM